MILRELLERSRATAAFRDAVDAFRRSGTPNDRIIFDMTSPPVKVERTLTKMLERHPELEVERVELQGSSGCEFYRGKLVIHTPGGARQVRFHWDCRWKALEQGWSDYFGYPDQIRAAREFGYDCFRDWTELAEDQPVLAVM